MAPCNEHPVECDEALSRHVTIRDNDTASACYTRALEKWTNTRDQQGRSDALELLEEDATFVVTKQLMTTTFTITRWFRNLFSTMTLASLTPSFKHLENWKGGFELRAEEWNCRLLCGNATSGCTVHSAPLFRVPSS